MKLHSVAMVAACPFPASWGTPGAIREISAALASIGQDIHVVTYPFGENMPIGAVKLWRIPYPRKSYRPHVGPSLEKLLLDLLLLFKLCRVVRREGISIIHAHAYEGALIGAMAKLITRRPLLYNAVNLMSDELPAYRFIRPSFVAKGIARLLDDLVSRFPDYFIAVTEELQQELIRRGVPEQRVFFIPCGINLEMFDGANPQSLRERYEVGERPVIMYAGVNSPFQRIDYLLRVFALVLRQAPNALLMVVSPLKKDPDIPHNRALAESLGLAGKVIWVDNHKLCELPDYLAMAAITAIPRPDVPGHPIKLLNYMAAGRPTVCFAGAAKGVSHLFDAFIVPDHDLEGMVSGILTLLRDPTLAARIGWNARETVATKFDCRRICTEVAAVYDLIAASASEATREVRPNLGSDVGKLRARDPEPLEAARSQTSLGSEVTGK